MAPGLLHAVQRLDVRGSGGPRGVAVRASARLGAPAQHVRGRVDSSLDRPSRADHGRRRPRGHQSPCRCARSAGHRQGALAQSGQSSARFHGRRRLRSRNPTSAAEAKPSVASASAICCEAKRSMSCAAWRSTSAALWPARSSRGSTSEGRPMIWGAGTWSGGRRQSRWAPGDAQRAVQPVAAAPQHVHRLVLRDAPRRGRCAGGGARNHRLRRLHAAFAEPAPQSRGPGRVQPVVAQGLAGIRAPIVAVGQEGRPVNSLGGRGKGTPS